MAIEEPVGGSGQRYAVLDCIGPTFFDRHDMGGLGFRAAASVDNAKARRGTGFLICFEYHPTKSGVPNNAA